MSLTKYNPRRFRTQGVNSFFDDLLNDNFFNTQANGENSFVPKVDIAETDAAFEIQFAIPGIDKKAVNIDLTDNVLTVSGERKSSNEKNEKNYHTIETSYGSFKRSFQLPDNVDADKVDATYEAGILQITIPKDEKKTLKKTIAIK